MVYRKLLTCGMIVLAGVWLAVSPMRMAGAEPSIFSTWDTFETDKCASIWLIKRFIAPEAEIRFYPRGEMITEGIPFDTPDARFRRYHNKSTFETLIEHYQIRDKKLVYLGRIMHDIEVNIWEQKVMPESREIERAMREIISQHDAEKIVAACRAYSTSSMISGYDAAFLTFRTSPTSIGAASAVSI